MRTLRSPASKLSLFLLLSINLFLIILVILTVFGIASAALIRFGWVPANFYERPVVGPLFFACVVSLFIGFSTLIMIDSVLIKPMHRMIDAVNELAKGNFGTRIRLAKGSHSLEINEFARSYNKAAEELGSVELLRKDFINNFSHEFKTPIISIKGFAELLQDPELPQAERDEYLEIMISESDRLARLAANILELSKIDSQKIGSGMTVFSVSEQVRRAILMAESKGAAKSLAFELEIDEVAVLGNPDLLKHAWVNILDNAIKFSPDGGTLAISVRRTEQSAQIRIRDEGPGMDETTLRHVFDQFYQGDTSHASEGNGLGMALVKKVLTLHGARIDIDSAPGEGTTVTVTLAEAEATLGKNEAL
ncbi:HAMP domain-containing sensor histidine kinase [Saccharibacillus sacchari]|uniref:HAMP domain-containing sensor histidine kinase n=1 Tax=Saccharibacillus sacchari TaxID=456493 RepID=A0ACC6P9H3_9BACL